MSSTHGTDVLTSQPAGILGGKETSDIGDVIRLSDPAQRGELGCKLTELRIGQALSVSVSVIQSRTRSLLFVLLR